MTTFTISLPDAIAKKVDETQIKHGFATRSEFFRDLLRQHFAKQVPFEVYETQPLAQVESDLQKTGKYSPEFISSVVKGFQKSSANADSQPKK